MAFLLGFPVDSGSPELSFIVLVRTIRAKYHWCSGGSKSELRPHSGAKFAFDHAPKEIQDQCRFEFEPIPSPLNKQYNKPDQLCNVGYSDAAACALAIAQYQPSSQQAIASSRPVLISCTFAPNHQLNQGFEGLLLDKVTQENESEAKDSLFHKWKAATSHNAMALVLHEEDAKLLAKKNTSSLTIIPLQKNTFTQLQKKPQPALVSCKTDQFPLLVQALNIPNNLFSSYQTAKKSKRTNSFANFAIFLSILLSLISCFFMFWFGKQFIQTSFTNELLPENETQSPIEIRYEKFRSALQNKVVQNRIKTIIEIGNLESNGYQLSQELRKQLSAPETNIRRKAIWALSKIEDHSPLLIGELYRIILEDPDPKVRVLAIHSLHKLKAADVSLMLKLLSDPAWMVRLEALAVLGRLKTSLTVLKSKTISSLIALLEKETNPFVRRDIIWILGECGAQAEKAIALLKNAQKESNPFIQNEASIALQKIRPQEFQEK